MRLILLIFVLFTLPFFHAQVGINTESPRATLDVVGLPTKTDNFDGIIAPRITGNELSAKTYTADQKGAIVYITVKATSNINQVINVKNSGYYYFDGSIWQLLKDNKTDYSEFIATNNIVHNTTDIATNNFVFGSVKLDDDPTTSDDDKRIFFDKSKGAFRAGFANNDVWDNSKRGSYSFGSGYSILASGNYSSAFGNATKSIGDYSSSLGNANTSNGKSSFTIGEGNIANGDYSSVLGISNTASSFGETIMGTYATSSSGNSTNFTSSDRLFTIGNGSSNSARNDALTILKNGNIGISNNAPQSRIDAKNGNRTGTHNASNAKYYFTGNIAEINNGFEIVHNNGTAGIGIGWGGIYATGTNGNNHLRIRAQANGPVFLEPNNAATSFIANQNAFYPGQASKSLGLPSNKWDIVYSSNGVSSSSDFRLKTNINNLNYGLSEILKLRPVEYNWKENLEKIKIGFIAQELKRIIPSIVTGDESKEYLGIIYTELIPVLTKAIQEQNIEIMDLKNENTDLKDRLKKIEQHLGL